MYLLVKARVVSEVENCVLKHDFGADCTISCKKNAFYQ